MPDGQGPRADALRREESGRHRGPALQVFQHPQPMRELSLVQDPPTGGLLCDRRPHARRDWPFGQPAHPGAVSLSAKTLEAERVVTIRTNFSAISELGFAILTRRAQDPGTLRPSMTFAARHGHPPDRLRTGTSPQREQNIWKGVTGKVIRPIFVSGLRRADPTLDGGSAISFAPEPAMPHEPMNIERLTQELAADLVLTRPLVCVDLEATGVWAGHDRIVQIATASISPDGTVSTWSSLVNPEQPIPPETTAIHGISDSMVAGAPTFAQVAETVGALLAGCDLAGYNVERFDRRLLAAEFRRAGREDPTVDACVIDAYTIFVRQEPRRLDDALRFYGVQEEQINRQPHNASSDVEATVAVLVAQLKTYSELPKTVDALHNWLYPRDPNRIDADGKLVWRDGVATVAFGAQAGTSLADLADNDRRFLEWVLRKDFSDDVKSICRAALAGQFPVRDEAESR